jgi:NAD(P)-dependent dehydrogenase (short-subunit alcohol dehydrogenase family)
MPNRAHPPFRRSVSALDVVRGLDLGGRVVLVTGADSGIGFETANAIASAGARVHLGTLTATKGEAARRRIVQAHPSAQVIPFCCDLSRLPDVRRAAAELPEQAIHAVVCNAGVYGGPYRRTETGMEWTLGICHVGHAALVLALKDRLVAGAPSRVVCVSSGNHRWPRSVDLDALPIDESRYSELVAYGHAKLCVVLFARALDARWAPSGVRANSLHPGDLVSTGIDKDSSFLRMVMALARPFSRSAAAAACTSTWLAVAPEAEHLGGGYFVNGIATRPSAAARDDRNVDRLWERTMQWTAAVPV